MKKSKCLVLLSGGQDSTTALFWAKQKYSVIIALNISYGQRHFEETHAAKKIAHLAGIDYHLVSTDIFKDVGDSALLETDSNISSLHRSANNLNLPSSFVPGRNILFLTIAAAYAYKWDISDIITGVCQTDFCVAGDTLIETPRNLRKFPNGIPIKDLVGKEFLVWSWDIEKQKTVLRPAFNVRKTKEQEKVYEVKYTWGRGKNLSYNSIQVNEDHRFLLTNGSYVRMKDLNIGDSLQPFHSAWDQKYRLITDSPGHVYYEHKMIAAQLDGLSINDRQDWVGHHKDENPMNNEPENIVSMDFSKHMSWHCIKAWKKGIMHENNLFLKDNPMKHKVFRDKVSKKKKEWWDNLSEAERANITLRAQEKIFEQMQREGYLNPSKLPGVKFKQRYAAYKRYGNQKGMQRVKKEAEAAGFSLNHKVVSIEFIGREDVYDMEVYDTHNFAANGIFIHNSGYPDCRDNTIKSLQVTLSLGMGKDFIIHAPLMWLTKAESVFFAQSLPECMEALKYSHTCYEGKYPPCGKCPSCILRAKGFEEAGITDPIFERDKI